jgi:hypothetical protein
MPKIERAEYKIPELSPEDEALLNGINGNPKEEDGWNTVSKKEIER